MRDLPIEVHCKILEGLDARTLVHLGITSATSAIAQAARALNAARQDAATQWCQARLRDVADIDAAMMEAVWGDGDLKPAIKPRDHFEPHEDTVRVFQKAIVAVADMYKEVDVRFDGLLLPTGEDRHQWGRLSVTLGSSMPSPIHNSKETLDLEVTITFERRLRQYVWEWHRHNQLRVALGTPALHMVWMVRQAYPVLEWQRVQPVWNPWSTGECFAVRHGSNAEFLADHLAVVRACLPEGVAKLCARNLSAAFTVPGTKARVYN